MSSSIDYVSSIEDNFDEEELKSITDGIEYHFPEDDEQAKVEETAAKPLADDRKDQVDDEGKVFEKPELTPAKNSVPAEGEQVVPSDNEKRSKVGNGKDCYKQVKRKAKEPSLDGIPTTNDKIIKTTVRIPERIDVLLGVCCALCKKSRNEYILDLINESLKDVLPKNGLEHLFKER